MASKQEILHAVNRFKNDNDIQRFITRLTSEGVYELMTLLDYAEEEVKDRWVRNYNEVFKGVGE